MGARIIDADEVARRLVDERSDIRETLRETFGCAIFDKSGKLLRRELGRIVFSDQERLETLNRILHPPLVEAVKDRISDLQEAEDGAVVVVDMAILYEAGLESLFDIVVVVSAPLERRVKWLEEEKGWSREEVLERMRAQMDVQEKMERADVVVENSGALEDLCRKARDWYKQFFQG